MHHTSRSHPARPVIRLAGWRCCSRDSVSWPRCCDDLGVPAPLSRFLLSLFCIGVALRRRSLRRAGREHFLDKLHLRKNCESNQLRMKPCGPGLCGRCHSWNIPTSECMLVCSQFAKIWDGCEPKEGSNGEASRLVDPSAVLVSQCSIWSQEIGRIGVVVEHPTMQCRYHKIGLVNIPPRLPATWSGIQFTIGIVAEMPQIQTLLPSESPSPRQNANGRASVGG